MRLFYTFSSECQVNYDIFFNMGCLTVSENTRAKQKIDEFQPVADRLIDLKKDVFTRIQSGEIGIEDGIPAKMTQGIMAEVAGCRTATWGDYESAKALPTPKILQVLIGYGYNANWILSGKGTMRLSDDWTLDKIEFNTVLTSVMEEVEAKKLKLPTEKLSLIISLAYDDFRLHKNIEKLKSKINEFIALLS